MVMKMYIMLFVVLVLASCSKDDPSGKYIVEYHIGCTDCQVVYISDTEGTQTTEYNQNSDWSYSFEAAKGQEVLLLAYNTSDRPQGVNVNISMNGEVLKDRTTYCAISGVSFAVDTIR